jgi:multiple sugar transport system permease protein
MKAVEEQHLVGTAQLRSVTASRRRRVPVWSADAPWVWLAPAVLLLVVYTIYPLLFNIGNSFREFNQDTHDFVWVGLANWQNLFQDARALNALKVTFTFGIFALAIELVLGMIIALVFDWRIYLKGLWQTLIVLPMVVPPTVTGLMFRLYEHSNFGVISWVLYGLGILHLSEPLLGGTGQNALAGVMIPDIWQWTPFVALILLAGLKGLPVEPLEAAEVDGASAWQKFWYVKLPMLRGVLAIVILFRIIDLFRLFDYVYVMTSGGPGQRTETLSYYAYQNYIFIHWGYAATLGVAIVVLVTLIATIYMRVTNVRF